MNNESSFILPPSETLQALAPTLQALAPTLVNGKKTDAAKRQPPQTYVWKHEGRTFIVQLTEIA
jgi:hypothetical protein